MNFSSVSGKNWIFKKFNTSESNKISEDFSLSEIVSKLISIRKKNIDDISSFLNPKIKNLLPNPFQLKDMNSAIERTCKAIVSNETIGVFGDYDVDGASSTALLTRYFLSINKRVFTYIPDRHKDGYGPSISGFNNLINKGCKIIFTVDCGTMSFKPISLAQKLKIDVIVLDHHQSDTKIPKACAVVNPNRYDDTSGLNYLCAAGVCFVFLVALNKKLRELDWFKKNKLEEPKILDMLDLVSLGTVCDVVPLVGLNRAIVKQGLKVIKKRTNLGLKTLFDYCNIESQPSAFDLGFRLGPRINAGGRLGKSSHGAELLISNDPKKIYQIVLDLDKSNKERQAIEATLTEKINLEAKKYHNYPVLVLSGENWHEGIIGIVASRIKEKYNKPTILISVNKDLGKGSARSVVGFDIGSQIIKAVQSGVLERGGGHKMAGGFTLKKKNISQFRDFLIKNFDKLNLDLSTHLNLYLDAIIAPSALNIDFFNQIDSLAPFGSGNVEPKFVIENTKVISSSIVGNSHIKAILQGSDGSVFKGFVWNGKETIFEQYLNKKNKSKISLAGKMKINQWKGEKKIEFQIEDISTIN